MTDVTVVARTVTTDPYGDTTTTETRTTYAGCPVAPRIAEAVESNTGNRTQVISGIDVFLPYDAEVNADDLLEIDGQTYEVDGEPGRWANPYTGTEAGMQVAARRVTG